MAAGAVLDHLIHGKAGIEGPHELGPTGLCVYCHNKHGTDKSKETQAYFHESIQRLDSRIYHLKERLHQIEERGLETDELEFELSGVADSLMETRRVIHAFDRSVFEKPFKEGQDASNAICEGIGEAEKEYTFRRNGLLAATLLITLFAVALYFKIRQIDRKFPIQ
ncbi:hypothetical protein ACFLU6_13380 [Acidobacteriota bacterium]